MAVISTSSVYREVVMSDKVAKEDIVQKNAYGQNVVVVAAGQPIPDDLPDEPAVPITQAEEASEPAVEDKAVRSSRSTSARKRKK